MITPDQQRIQLDVVSENGLAPTRSGGGRIPIYQLFPAVADAPEWQSSAFQGPVLVRAETEDHARDLASDRYWIASKAEGRTAPWSRVDLVQAAVLTQPRYPTDGRSMIGGAHGPDLTVAMGWARVVRTGLSHHQER